MLKDPKVSRFALEFFGQWLGYRDFLKQEAVNRQVFPMFDDALKQAMFEEPTRLCYLPGPARPAHQRAAQRRRHARQQAAGPALWFAVSGPGDRVGAGWRPARARPRRGAGHGRVPDEKLPAAADQSGQARLLGRPQNPRRAHPTAARRRRRPARQGNGHQRQDDPPAAGPAHRRHALRPLPSALRSDRAVDGRLRSHRPEPGQGPGGPAGG